MKIHREKMKFTYCVFGYFSLIFLGIGLWIYKSKIIDSLLDMVLILKPSSIIYDEWRCHPMQMRIGLWNWTNPVESLEKKAKPKFKEIFVQYDLKEEKIDLVHHPNDTISFDIQRYFFFDEKSSELSESDNITSINVVPLQFVRIVNKLNVFLRKTFIVGLSVTKPTLSIKRTVSELLFGGYQDPVIDLGNKLGLVKVERAGWFNGKNGSTSGIFNIGSGVGRRDFSHIYSFKYGTRTSYPDKCGELGSSMTEILPQNQNLKSIRVFVGEFERMAVFDYKETFIYEGVEVQKYVANSSFFDCGNINKNNSCSSDLMCRKFGTIGHKTTDADVYFSLPHFLHADAEYRSNVEGMKPDETEHSSYYLLNARTGVPLKINLAYQLNILMEPEPSSSIMGDLPEIMMPVLWYKVTYDLPEYLKILMRVLLIWLPMFFTAVSFLLIILGSFLVMRLFYFSYMKSDVTEPITRNFHEESEPLKENVRKPWEVQ